MSNEVGVLLVSRGNGIDLSGVSAIVFSKTGLKKAEVLKFILESSSIIKFLGSVTTNG